LHDDGDHRRRSSVRANNVGASTHPTDPFASPTAHLRNAFSGIAVKSSQVNIFPKAKSKTRSKQNKDMHKCSSVYSERGVPLPVLTSGGE
jgi:hypothetical protein